MKDKEQMDMEKSFKQSVIEGLRCYVYALVDPRDNRIFYVGKGTIRICW